MRRRKFITLLGGAAAWPLAALAQQAGRTYRVGGLSSGPRNSPPFVAMFDELRRFGFIEGQNLTIDWRSYALHIDLIPEFVAELVKSKVDIIYASGDAAKASGAAALNVLSSPILYGSRQIIIQRVAALRLPAIYQFPEEAEEGGFIGYGPRVVQLYRELVASMLVKLLRGAKPADLPIEQPTKFELVINLKTAKALGLAIPESFLIRADELIE